MPIISSATMWGFPEVCRVAASLVAALLAAVLLRDHPRDRSAQASVLLIAAVVAHLMLPLLPGNAWLVLVHAVLLLNLAVPLAFWLLSQVHFDDDFRPRPAHLAIGAGLLAIGYRACLPLEGRLADGWLPSVHDDLWIAAQKVLSIAVVIHALIRIYVGAGSDLLVPRLKLRYGVLLCSGTYLLVELFGELALRGSPSAAAADPAHSAAVLGILFVTSFVALRTSPQILKPVRVGLDVPVADPVLLDRLKRLMEGEGIYRQEGLTMRILAERLGAQEYKLRALINAQLGFKNFNAFLHHHRIRDARIALADPSGAHLGVAQIAYEVGYRSLATFNKAFKDLTGHTPTEFRAANSSTSNPADEKTPGLQN